MQRMCRASIRWRYAESLASPKVSGHFAPPEGVAPCGIVRSRIGTHSYSNHACVRESMHILAADEGSSAEHRWGQACTGRDPGTALGAAVCDRCRSALRLKHKWRRGLKLGLHFAVHSRIHVAFEPTRRRMYATCAYVVRASDRGNGIECCDLAPRYGRYALAASQRRSCYVITCARAFRAARHGSVAQVRSKR
jgi:hypothetical protein